MSMMMGGGQGSNNKFTLGANYAAIDFSKPDAHKRQPMHFSANFESSGQLQAMMAFPLKDKISAMVQLIFPGNSQIPRQQYLIVNAPLGKTFHSLRLGNFEQNYSFVQSIGHNSQLGISFTYMVRTYSANSSPSR